MVISIMQKLLPVLNFFITSTALDFQISVLHPWYHQQATLHEYEDVKMQNIKNIEEYLVKFNIDRAEDP